MDGIFDIFCRHLCDVKVVYLYPQRFLAQPRTLTIRTGNLVHEPLNPIPDGLGSGLFIAPV